MNKPTRRQQRTKRRRNQKEKKQKKRTQKKSPIRSFPPPKHTLAKKLGMFALASSQGIPFKRNQLQYGESGVKDIEYDIAKHHGLTKSAYKVAKEASKKYARQIKIHRPEQKSFLPVVEEPDPHALSTIYSSQKLPSTYQSRTRKRKK